MKSSRELKRLQAEAKRKRVRITKYIDKSGVRQRVHLTPAQLMKKISDKNTTQPKITKFFRKKSNKDLDELTKMFKKTKLNENDLNNLFRKIKL